LKKNSYYIANNPIIISFFGPLKYLRYFEENIIAAWLATSSPFAYRFFFLLLSAAADEASGSERWQLFRPTVLPILI